MVPKELFKTVQRAYRRAEQGVLKDVSKISADYSILAELIYHKPMTPEEADLDTCMNNCVMSTMPLFQEQRIELLADAKSRLDHLAVSP